MRQRQVFLRLLLITTGIIAALILASANSLQKSPETSSNVGTDEKIIPTENIQAESVPVFMKEYEIVSDEQYTYYLDENGFPFRIKAKDYDTMTLTTPKSDSFGEAEAAKKAEELFDQVFPEAVKMTGREKEMDIVEGQTWLVTIYLLEDGYDTGYTASVSFTLAGSFISAVFIPGEEERPEILITEEQAVWLAKETLLTYCRETYGNEAKLHFEKMSDLTCIYRAFRGSHFWSIESSVPMEKGPLGKDYELRTIVKIDVQTGEGLEIAKALIGVSQ